MTNNTTIKVSKKTLENLHKIAGEIAASIGKRVTLEDAINHLLEEKNKKRNSDQSKIDKDREKFLTLLNQKITGGQPEDYSEYNYEDIGNT